MRVVTAIPVKTGDDDDYVPTPMPGAGRRAQGYSRCRGKELL